MGSSGCENRLPFAGWECSKGSQVKTQGTLLNIPPLSPLPHLSPDIFKYTWAFVFGIKDCDCLICGLFMGSLMPPKSCLFNQVVYLVVFKMYSF